MFAVDTNIVLDILEGSDAAAAASADALEEASQQGALVASGLVWAELAVRRDADEVDWALGRLRITVDWGTDRDVLLLAVAAYRTYVEQRGQRAPSFVCPHCGQAAGPWQCPHCGEPVPPPRHILPDFLIGGHAQARGLQLITRDRGIYRQYFPGLTILQPR